MIHSRPGGEADTAYQPLGEGTADPFTVKIVVRRAPTGWLVQLSRTLCEPAGDGRLRLAVKRLCELDVLVARALSDGHTVRRTLPRQPSLDDGPHSAVEQITPLLLPRRVDDALYRYQRQGVAWLLRHDRALLGDDMGLGKTAQALAGVRRLIRSGAVAWSLVVAPRTLVANWLAEAQHWAPELTVASALPLGASREEWWQRRVRRAHVLVTSYEQLREPAGALIRNPPDLVIADEAHRLRKMESLATQGFRGLRSKRFWALTGTPVERDAEDLAVLMSLIDPTRFSIDDRALHPTALRARVRPYLLRRRKDDVLGELPPVIEEHETLELTPQQQVAYRAAIAEHSTAPQGGGFLVLFGRLRTICDVDPATGASSKLDRAVEVLSDITDVGEKVVVFSYILEPLRRLRTLLAERSPQIGHAALVGDMPLDERAAVVDRFKTDRNCTALLASTRVASEGLTLTEANHVLFINRWWNPSANAQARDRVVRIGQVRAVRVKSFTCRRTVEERLDGLLAEKSLTFEQLVEALGQSSSELSRRIFDGS